MNRIIGNTVGTTMRPTFKEVNLYDFRDFDNYNHRTIAHNGACNVMYRGTMGGSVPYIMSIQIAHEDIPRTYQTVLYSGVCKKRWYGDEWGNDGSNEKWSEWEDVGGSDTPNILNSNIGYVDEIDTYRRNGELYYITTKVTYYGFNPYYLFVFGNGQEYTQIRLDGGGIYKRKYQYFEGMADENSGAIIPEGWRWTDWVGFVDSSDLIFDPRPTKESSNFVTSGVVFDSLGNTAEALDSILEIQNQLMGVSE